MSQIALDSGGAAARRGLARRCFRKGLRLGIAATDRLLAPLVPMLYSEVERDIPCVFIVGGPRTGSTLFYQAMLHSFRFAYISNEIARFPRSGPVAARLLRADRKPLETDFSSSYGSTSGAVGPSEGGAFWDLTFPWTDHHTVDPEDWPLERQRFARRHIGALVDLFQAPFLCKNVWHSVRLEALNQAFPGAAFIVMRRDPLLMAQSIMKKQRANLLASRGFWSVRPRELMPKMRLPLAQQVAWQIVLTEQAIERARERLGEGRFLDVPYEEFCKEPGAWIERVGSFLEARGIAVQRRAPIQYPFAAHRSCSLDDGERAQIDAVRRAV